MGTMGVAMDHELCLCFLHPGEDGLRVDIHDFHGVELLGFDAFLAHLLRSGKAKF